MLSIAFGNDRVFEVGVRDLLGAPVETIVNPANSGLSHGGGVAAMIADEAGPRLENQCRVAVKKFGRVPVTYNVVTGAGRLPYKCVIHAVGPRMGDGDERKKIEDTIANCLRRAESLGLRSIAFPAISTGLFAVPVEICAQAFKAAVPFYWQTTPDSCIERIFLCLTTTNYETFEKILSNGKLQWSEAGMWIVHQNRRD
jgi:O-acetyl-ADP-ribose deacetylase (regulator of RNase III)